MRRRLAPWLVSLVLMLVGTEVAHWLSYRLVYPDPYERALVLAQTGHGYFGWLPLVGRLGCALLVSALVLHAVGAQTAGSAASSPALSRFAVLPPLAFALQEHIERIASSGSPLGVVLEPTFLPGLLFTLPFALLAYLAARLLLRLAERVGRVFARRRWGLRRVSVGSGLVPETVFAPRIAALAAGHAERGPPILLAARV